MTPARFEAIEEIFHSAIAQPQDQRNAFLTTACRDDDALRCEVEVLLSCYPGVGEFIETPVVNLAATILELTQPELLTGQRIAHYELLERIGAGGMGEVYLAKDVVAGRKAALKLLPELFTDEPERLRRFEREAQAVVALNHPNIVTVYEIGEDRDTHYIASELIEGETLRRRLARGRMELDQAIDVAIQVATALAAAHEAGIVHRDIKPENIMVRPDGYVKVLDFGIAKLAEQEVPVTLAEEEAVLLVETNLGPILGTVRYMSPEQARGAPVDKATDSWSLGVVLYEMITGRAPFTGDTPGEVMASILETEPPLLSSIAQIPPELQQIVSRALSKERKNRYPSAHELLGPLKSLRRSIEFKTELERSTAVPPRARWIRSPTAAMLLVLVAALAVALPFYWRRNLTTGLVPEKSIAVLPFENLSDNKDSSDFGAGIQDDVLTSLAQIHELKVISRTSVMAYQKPGVRNMREITRALGVANVLEGSVRREGNRVLVNVQLIDARNDRHLWAQHYDRTVADSIGLQGELATQIAAALKTTLAPEEMARFAVKPTANTEAYVLYLTALGKEATDWSEAEQLYVQATTVDPTFALAYARASLLNSWFANYANYRERTAKARAQAEEALRLSPTLGEAHMARALCLYIGEKKYDVALKEFEVAAATSPNNAKIYNYVGGIYRRQGRWRDATASFERALSLDPRNVEIALSVANHHLFMRDWPGAIAAYNHSLTIAPGSVFPKVALAYLEVCRNGNPAAGRKILQDIPAGRTALTRWNLFMLERDYASAEKALNDFASDDLQMGYPSKAFYAGRIALARGDLASAQRSFAVAMPAFKDLLRDDPDNPQRHAELGLLYAYMRRDEDALRESRRAVELEPESQNAFHGALYAANVALVYALIGEQEKAITLVERLLVTPGSVGFPDCAQSITLADLRLRWEWDSLRSNPRFRKILAGSEPKTNLTNITRAAPEVPEKSIAVLPLENLSDDKQNTYFAAGIQDEILTDLARIADLKVVSRTSTSSYQPGQPRNSRQIGEELGVAHLLEGSVQRIAQRVRINAQLIDTRTDSHLWAQTYERNVADIFAIQSEIAKAIAAQLQSRISQRENAAIAEPPTSDLIAHKLYLQGVSFESGPSDADGLRKGIKLLEQAVARDPRFLRAYCALARMHLLLYDVDDHTPGRLQATNAAIEKAARLEPDAGEVHLVRAHYLSRALRDYDRARAELELARRTMPNDPALYFEGGLMDRRQGRSAEALGSFDRAVELDPRNAIILAEAAATYAQMRRYARATELYRRELAVAPQDNDCRLFFADISTSERADIRPYRAELNVLVANDTAAVSRLAGKLWECAFLERDGTAADRALAAMPPEGYRGHFGSVLPKEWYVGQTARLFNRPDAARQAFAVVCAILEKHLREAPDDGMSWSFLGRAKAALGEKDQAIAAGRHACDVWPLSKEPVWGLQALLQLAKIYAAVGEKDMAIQQLSACAEQSSFTDYGDLKLSPYWDPLRGDPRFEQIVNSLAPK